MKSLRLLLLPAFALLVAPVQAQAPSAPKAEIEATIRHLDSLWLQARLTRDTASVTQIVADEFVATFGDDLVTKHDVLQNVARGLDLEDPQRFADDQSVFVYGNVAIIRGRGNEIARNEDGPFHRRWRYTDVYLWRDGRWQCVAAHWSSLPPSDP